MARVLFPARLEGARSMKKSRLVDKTKRLLPSMDTPQGRPPKERNGPRNTNIPRTGQKVKPAGQKKPGKVKAGRSPPEGSLDGSRTMGERRRGAHTLRVDPG